MAIKEDFNNSKRNLSANPYNKLITANEIKDFPTHQTEQSRDGSSELTKKVQSMEAIR